MESRDQQEHDQQQGADPARGHDEQQGSDPPPHEGRRQTGEGGPESPQVIGTDAPLIAMGPASQSDWASHPDRNMVIQTSRIREPNEAFNPSFVMVPVESEPPTRGRSGAGNGEGKVSEGQQEKGGQGKGRDSRGGQEGHGKKGQSGSDEGHNDDQSQSGKGDKGRHGPSSQSPSMIRTVLIPAVVALVCGVVGAWGYSHFFGSDKSGDQSSGGDSGSSKGGGDSGSSKGGGDSSSGKGGGSGKGSETRKNSTSNDKNSSKLIEAEEAWLAAVKELRQAKESEKAARSAEEEKKAILNYLRSTLLSAGRPGDASLSEAFWAGGEGKDVTLRKALDLADSRATDSFAERPLAEAGVREMLGLGYLNVGEPKRAVQEYERALALREATQGPNHPDAAACRNQLAVAYRIAGRTTEAARLFDRNPNTPAHAAALAVRGMMLLLQKSPAEAELKLREALTIRRKIQPDDWTTSDTMSMLGEALTAQKKYDEAEPLLLSGYEGLKQREDTIPTQDRSRIAKALERLVAFYEARGDKDKASRWRQELEATTAVKKA